MTDAEYKAQKKRVGKYLDKWMKPMGLLWWKIDVTWDRSYCTRKPGVAAETEMNRWQYREADITFYLPCIADYNDETVENVVVHELCHVLLAPFSVNMENLNDAYQVQVMEFATQMVCKALMWVSEEGKK